MKMRPRLLLLLFSLVLEVVTSAEPSGTIRLFESAADHVLNFWEVPVEEMNKWPLWTVGDEPPISVRQAIAISLKGVKDPLKYQLESVRIQYPLGNPSLTRRRAFFFVIEFERLDRSAKETNRLVVLVNMAGRIIPMRTASLQR